MSQKMPYSDHKWLKQSEIQQFDVTTISDESDVGYILEVDLHYPKELHDLHNDFPAAPVQRNISSSEWSNHTQKLAETFHLKVGSGKLVADLHHKEKYVVHYRNLKLYMKLGLKLMKIHRIIAFNQSFWLRDYIELNTAKRKNAKNAFEKDFFKLMNYSVFGKTMENVRKRIDLQLVNEESALEKLTGRPQFKCTRIINADLVSVQSLVKKVKINKPIYVGFCILDISKTLMYEFHYSVIKSMYNDKAKLCFTDTDSLFYHIETEDIDQDMLNSIHLYDTSDYPTQHVLHSSEIKKVLGKMKDEMAGKIIEEFVGLRSKMYSLKTIEGVEKKTAKGIKRSTIRQKLRHDMYRDCLFSSSRTYETVRNIRSINHEIFTVKQTKLALSSFDDKRYVLNDQFSTNAHGHFRNTLYEEALQS